MSNYRDPKVTTTENKSSVGKWIGIAIAVILALILLAWALGSFDEEEAEVVPMVTEEGTAPVVVPPAE
ncbi:hypothetical protein GTW51_10370 [Aurantimonas aggregata]|uniref:Uncharacterized protein n=1 Tax=Aurantimonas aggregata TaxID=2047720 RepID=A0A6L9MHG1_9HYPH|nr:hypothetical protein [Aurantimonas aggregata]NDV87106.1 hypothetical protein [Aurantimonas aggregata]